MPNSDLKVLGEKVRKERKLAGLTQEQLAERCHVSTKHIANIEKGSIQRHQKQCRPHLVGNIVFRHTTAFFLLPSSGRYFLFNTFLKQ